MSEDPRVSVAMHLFRLGMEPEEAAEFAYRLAQVLELYERAGDSGGVHLRRYMSVLMASDSITDQSTEWAAFVVVVPD